MQLRDFLNLPEALSPARSPSPPPSGEARANWATGEAHKGLVQLRDYLSLPEALSPARAPSPPPSGEARARARANWAKTYMWSESYVEFMRTASESISAGPVSEVDGGNSRTTSASCSSDLERFWRRERYLRSYTFTKKKETMWEKTRRWWCRLKAMEKAAVHRLLDRLRADRSCDGSKDAGNKKNNATVVAKKKKKDEKNKKKKVFKKVDQGDDPMLSLFPCSSLASPSSSSRLLKVSR